ncbi:MAG: hypothetical protein LBL46_02800 [Rickettsiales bacterium]|jgi:hypothetical protein|nr:hypothetical protein [Rickettsiales bacterium]
MKKRIRELENKRMDFEIKGKRVRTAAFSYSLILLFSALGNAQGAKLCLFSGGEYFENDKIPDGATEGGVWRIGDGCRGGSWTDPKHSSAVNCTKTYFSGTASCSASGTACYCKMTYPYNGNDFNAYADNSMITNMTQCRNLCPIICSYYIWTNPYYRNSAFLPSGIADFH